jgi:hypothetical protein
LQFAGRNSEAVALLERGARRWPTETALHKLLAQAYWQRGDGEDCTRELERAISPFPGELQLRLVARRTTRHHRRRSAADRASRSGLPHAERRALRVAAAAGGASEPFARVMPPAACAPLISA